ncbi:MAG: hypothetical protein JJU06_06955 [Ectothiorhodospiraceae bacterium]|nr:hypothetical protein [Ectothiorhodospiraceae bacterium]MCH8502754.1 hypothetical protein [Ectothiorhodospiraceae bacterium]
MPTWRCFVHGNGFDREEDAEEIVVQADTEEEANKAALKELELEATASNIELPKVEIVCEAVED